MERVKSGSGEKGDGDDAVSMVCRQADEGHVVFLANHSGRDAEVEVSLPESSGAARWFDPATGEISPLAVESGMVTVALAPHGSGFVEVAAAGGRFFADGTHSAKRRKKTSRTTVPLREKFTVAFGDFEVEMPELKDWTAFDDPRVRYFSGTAVYRCRIESAKCKAGEEAVLSLGDCNGQIARVAVNGIDCGTVWCDPYEVEIPRGVLREDGNELEVEFTNVWANRLIGDEFEPQDCEFAPAPKQSMGQFSYLARYPGWFAGGVASRPSKGRRCFVDWNYFTKDSPLVPSGLLGPVEIRK